MGDRKTPMLKGTLDMLILQVLTGGPQHGYAITRHLEELTDAVLQIEEGSMYPSLYRMEKRGWIVSTWERSDKGRRARVYRITPSGERHLDAAAANWERFADAVFKVLPSGGPR